MTDLSTRPPLSCSPLGVGSYFDEAHYARELQTIFATAPRYLGHRLAVPELGDYYTLPHEGDGRLLVNTETGIQLVSNVCRHRQALIHHGRGSLLQNSSAPGGSIVCPIHRWTYSPAGKLLGAPKFDRDPCLDLSNYPVQEWNGLLFEAPSGPGGGRRVAEDLAGLDCAAALDFTGYALDRVELHECNYNWKTFIEVYLEDYHVVPFHPGLGNFVTCDDLAWELRPGCSVQTVGVSPRLGAAGSPVFERWHQALLQYQNGAPVPYGAIWLTYYPNVISSGIRIRSRSRPWCRRVRKRPSMWSSSSTPRRSPPSSANSCTPSRRPTWKPAARTTRSANAWMPAGARCCTVARTPRARIRARWKTACSTSTSGTWSACRARSQRPAEANQSRADARRGFA